MDLPSTLKWRPYWTAWSYTKSLKAWNSSSSQPESHLYVL